LKKASGRLTVDEKGTGERLKICGRMYQVARAMAATACITTTAKINQSIIFARWCKRAQELPTYRTLCSDEG